MKKIDIQGILNYFKINNDIFNEEDDNIIIIKQILWNDLSDTERRILLLYIDLGNLRQSSKLLHCSYGTVYNRLRDIKEKILKRYYEICKQY